MGWVDVVRVQVGRAFLCLAAVVLALGLRPLPVVAWLAAVVVNVLLASSLAAPLVARVARRDAVAASSVAALAAAAATFAPALAPVAADTPERLALAGGVLAAAYVGWRLYLAGAFAAALDEGDGERSSDP